MANLIIGHTTEKTTQIWVRGDARHRTATVEVREKNLDSVRAKPQPMSVDLRKEEDYTAVLSFPKLEPDTSYSVTARFCDTPWMPVARGRGNVAHGEVRTYAPHLPDKPFSFSFVLASCNLSIVSINNFIALLLAMGGSAAARQSLKRPLESWQWGGFTWLRGILRHLVSALIWIVAWFVRKATGGKQPGKPYLRSPFLKLCELFDSCTVEFERDRCTVGLERSRRPPAVGDLVEDLRSRAKGVLAYQPTLSEGAWNERTAKGRLVLTRLEGKFEEGGRLESAGKWVGCTVSARTRDNLWYERPDFFIHAGDQIYYDFPYPDRRPEREEYRLAYREAWFEDETLRHVLSHWPHYMTLDDHELVDQFAHGFLAPRPDVTAEDYLVEATTAYREYVHCRNPPNADESDLARQAEVRRVKPRGKQTGPFFYKFNRGKAWFFVLDTRTRRYERGSKEDCVEEMGAAEIIDQIQMADLCEWMREHKNDLKFVVTSVPFVAQIIEMAGAVQQWQTRPDRSNDTWSAHRFASQRSQIIEHIRDERIERLVFLTGDGHCCYHAIMRIGEGTKYQATTVHELAAGPVYQLQLGKISQFVLRHSNKTEKKNIPFTVVLDQFHSDATAVMHLKVAYADRTGFGSNGETRYTPEVEWSVIRTLTEPKSAGSSERPPGEPAMTGRISFVGPRDFKALP